MFFSNNGKDVCDICAFARLEDGVCYVYVDDPGVDGPVRLRGSEESFTQKNLYDLLKDQPEGYQLFFPARIHYLGGKVVLTSWVPPGGERVVHNTYGKNPNGDGVQIFVKPGTTADHTLRAVLDRMPPSSGAMTRKECLAELEALGYTGPTSYLLPKLQEIVADQKKIAGVFVSVALQESIRRRVATDLGREFGNVSKGEWWGELVVHLMHEPSN